MTSTRSPRIIAARTQTILLASALSLWSMPALAQARPERVHSRHAMMTTEEPTTMRIASWATRVVVVAVVAAATACSGPTEAPPPATTS